MKVRFSLAVMHSTKSLVYVLVSPLFLICDHSNDYSGPWTKKSRVHSSTQRMQSFKISTATFFLEFFSQHFTNMKELTGQILREHAYSCTIIISKVFWVIAVG